MKLVIVESPAKCKKIESYLGKDYKVIASYGHICKLSSLDQINFETYDIKFKNDKHKVIKTIKEYVKKADKVILATDDDREGEAISWHICNVCKLPIDKTEKITFQEITKSAILESMKHSRTINMDRVNSQFTRQILDIVVGFKISPLLWKYVQSKISAGRCQTPALKLIYDNEMLFENRVIDTHHIIKGYFSSKNIEFKLENELNKEIEEFMLSHNEQYELIKFNKTEKVMRPPNPFITSTLQQRASSLLKFPPKVTMKSAQTLYENGLITYMRTDSMCYSKEFIDLGKKYIETEFGESYVSKNILKLKNSKSKGKTQDAHEGIRITDITKETNNISHTLDNNCKRLYELIRKNTISSMMSNALYDVIKYQIIHKYQDVEYKYSKIYDVNTFLGWKILEKETVNKDNDISCKNILYLDSLKDNIISLRYLSSEEKLKDSMSHYNEASLISQLESKNIGRPSTYASIMDSIISKKYVNKCNIDGVEINSTNYKFIPKDKSIIKKEELRMMNSEKNKLKITILGKQVVEFLYKYCPSLFDYEFTNDMELRLDSISNGNSSKNETLDTYMKVINENVNETKEYFKENKDQVTKLKKSNSFHCGQHNNSDLIIKHGKYGYYISYGKTNKSLNGIKIDIENIINTQECSENERNILIEYIETSTNKNIVLECNENISIRNGKYGQYIFHKTATMKKPKFYKLDKNNDVIKVWILNKDIDNILEYITTKYDIK